MSDDGFEVESAAATGVPQHDAGPLGDLPRLRRRQVQLDRLVGQRGPRLVVDLTERLSHLLGDQITADRFEVQWRAAGLKRPGVVAHLAWPRLQTRVALGVDPPLAHALVDRLLGYERSDAEARLQVSPVEWGILSFVAASGLTHLERQPGPLGDWDLTIDRVGPDPFDPGSLGSIVTWRWLVRVGKMSGAARLWIPESLLALWLADAAVPGSIAPRLSAALRDPAVDLWDRFRDLSSEWRAEVGCITLGASDLTESLRSGRLVLIDGGPLTGTVESPVGQVTLVQADRATRSTLRARLEPGSLAQRLIVTSLPQRNQTFGKPFMTEYTQPDPANLEVPATDQSLPLARLDAGDISVTLVVELGRVNLPLPRLAELQPGDVLELARHAQEPVELSSNGRLLARGELVQIDTELGVRITQTFF